MTPSRRKLLRVGGASVAGGALLGSASTASAGTVCGDCSSDTIYGEKVKIKEYNGHGAWYQIVLLDGFWEEYCFKDSLESGGCDGNSSLVWSGFVKNGSDSILMSGGAIKYIRVCDISDPGAFVSVTKEGYCGSPCHVDYDGYNDIKVSVGEGGDGPGCGCPDYDGSSSIGEPYYYINLTAKMESASYLEGDDRIISTYGAEAEGYVDYDSDADYYYGNGIIESVNVEPKGHDVWIETRHDQTCP